MLTSEVRWASVHRWITVSLLATWFAGTAATAQPGPPTGVRGGPVGGMATRSVSKYLGLERALQEGLTDRKRASVRALLADDFELRTAASPDVIGVDEWLRRELAAAAHDRLVQDLAVRELDDVAVVSFLLEPARARPAGRAVVTMFVVDVWRQSPSKLMSRYIVQPAAAPAPRARPTGRE